MATKRKRLGGEIKSADSATEAAVSFLKRYYPFIRPIKAVKADHFWIVEADVGAFLERVAKVHIDMKTGAVTEFNVPKVGAASDK